MIPIALTKYEMETIINYNQEEPTASVYTHDKSLIRRLDAMTAERPTECSVESANSDRSVVSFIVPKRWVKIRPPRQINMTDEQKKAVAERMRSMRTVQNGQL